MSFALSGVFLSLLIGEMEVRSVNMKKTKSSRKIVLKITMSMTLRCTVGHIVNKIVKETRGFFYKVPSGHFDGQFYNVPSMDPQGTL